MKRKVILWLVVAAVVLAGVLALMCGKPIASDAPRVVGADTMSVPSAPRRLAPPKRAPVASSAAEDRDGAEDAVGEDADSVEAESLTEEEKREAAEEKLVNDFDDLTDKWQEASEKGVTMSDIDTFAKAFRNVPSDRQDECIHRALNLIPDENVMLLAGVLMDKSMDKEIVETVFNDILNRDEDVKMPILQQIHKDKTHPCWEDADWILNATDESPLSK